MGCDRKGRSPKFFVHMKVVLSRPFPPAFDVEKNNCSRSNNILIPSQIENFLTYKDVWRDITKYDTVYALSLKTIKTGH